MVGQDHRTEATIAATPAPTVAAGSSPSSRAAATTTTSTAAVALAAAIATPGCGGGASVGTVAATGTPSRAQASRFLSQASLSTSATEIERVRTLGYAGWLDEQFAMPRSQGHVEWLRSQGYDGEEYVNSQAGANNTLWRKLIGSPDMLRQRMALALSEIVVIGLSGLAATPFRAFAAGYFMDILEANAFGSYRTLLLQVSKSPAMGAYLTYRGNQKANAGRGSIPDENYAREIMQLFTIGLLELNLDGTVKLVNGAPKETYTQEDVSGLARVFTGWNLNTAIGSQTNPDRVVNPMVMNAALHETGSKVFLGTTIPANTSGEQSLELALDALISHANVGPFIGRQLIQRFVTSHPSPAYVARVASVFNNNGSGVKGDLKAVLRQVLLDEEARSDKGLADPQFGKLREPVLRFVHWARTFGATSANGRWDGIGDLSDPATRLGQSPLRSSSVFNFFRPGYVPPNSAIGDAAITAPEFQITTESSVAGYVNFMQTALSRTGGDFKADYSALAPLVSDSAKLLDELNVLLAAGQVPAATLATLKAALDTISTANATGQNNRLFAALTLVLAAPEYITLK